jgi:hypothetical protein
MFIVRNSVRAFTLALLPLGFVHGVLLVMALLGSQTEPPMMALPSPDRALGMLALRVALDGGGLLIGHFVCRGLGVGSRAAYALLGGIAAAGGYAISVRAGLVPLLPGQGAVITAGLLPTLAGMIAGFLYGQFAGREPAGGRDPAAATKSTARPDAAAATSASPAVFDGPVQVRTSLAAMALASLIPAFLIALMTFALTYNLVSGNGDVTAPMRFEWSRQVMALAMPAQMFLSMAMMSMAPAALFVALAHAIARGLRRTRGLDYAGAGAALGAIGGIVLIPFGGWPSFPFTGVGFLILPLAVIGAIMMAVYRRFAGLEPRSLPEPVLAADRKALVPEDHPSRRSHAVVLNG